MTTKYSLENIRKFINTPAVPLPDDAGIDDDSAGTKADKLADSEAGKITEPDDHHVKSLRTADRCQNIQPTTYDGDRFFTGSTSCDLNQQIANQGCARGKILPEVLVFKDGTGVRIIDTAENLGKIYEKKEIFFRRQVGNGKAQEVQTLDNERNLKILAPELACSEFEKVASLTYYKKGKTIPAVLKESDSKRIICCSSFVDKLPPLKIITKCPVIVETPDGDTKIITRYDRHTGIFAAGERPVEMDVHDAIEILLSSIEEFSFQSPADQSRALASIITPALIMGGIGRFRSPIDLIEADDSQAGKGFKAKISASYYNETPHVINQQRGGVGSMEESLNQALIEGRNFINLDNLKPVKSGVFDSEKLCSLMTEDAYFARMLHKGMFIDPRVHIIQVTTNGCSLSTDLMNRASPIAIRKRYGHSFKKYPEGSILDHIRHNQSKFLGAVFSIIRAWVREGKPKTSTTTHESGFTPWAQSLDWIVQNIMGQAPLLEGYEQVRDRITSPYLQNLREIALAVIKTRRNQWLTASDILEEVGPTGIKLPGTEAGYDYGTMTDAKIENAKRQLGLSFKRAFDSHGDDDILILDGIHIMRKEEAKTYDTGITKDIKYYNFSD